ncbi:MAG: exosome complex RNA-binding protein Rrp4 [Candidatus Hadarchaeales archaeon]
MLFVSNRELVVPGKLLADEEYQAGEGTFIENGKIFSAVVGLAEVRDKSVGVISLQGRYIPRQGDKVIGIVIDTHPFGWIVDLNSPYTGNLMVSDLVGRKVDVFKEDLGKFLKIGDAVIAEVRKVDERWRVQLIASERGLGKIRGGRLVEISPAKVPRVIGRRGSMLKVLEETTGCKLEVGLNGRILVRGKDPKKINSVVEAILLIEREAHLSGLTDRIKAKLEKER